MKSDLRHLKVMTDQHGLLEHGVFSVPDKLEGYSIDDNARALQLLVRTGITDEREMKMAETYLKFLISARGQNGFHNDLGADLKWLDEDSLGEAFARTMEALAETAVTGPKELARPAALIFDQQALLIKKPHSARVKAHLIWALYHRSRFDSSDKEWIAMKIYSEKDGRKFGLELNCEDEVRRLANEIIEEYKNHWANDWRWFEDSLTYDNSRIPFGLLGAYKMTKEKNYLNTATEALDWLIEKTWDKNNDCFSWVGNKGWWNREGIKATYDQQDIEAGSMVEACVAAYEANGEVRFKQKALAAFEWYNGKNIEKLSLVDEKSGGIKDALIEGGVNPNEGAESVLSYLTAKQELKKCENNK